MTLYEADTGHGKAKLSVEGRCGGVVWRGAARRSMLLRVSCTSLFLQSAECRVADCGCESDWKNVFSARLKCSIAHCICRVSRLSGSVAGRPVIGES